MTARTALVTGANRGIGRTFVDGLLARGVTTVYAAARDPRQVLARDGVIPVSMDVTDVEAVERLARELTDVDLVINNAGVAHLSTPMTADLAVARTEMEVNYLGTLSVSRAFAPVLATNGGGAIVNMLSVASWVAIAPLTTYSASKAAQWLLTNALREELRQHGTKVVGVHVGFVDTDMAAAVPPEQKVAPETVVQAALDALDSGLEEVLVDDWTRAVKAGLSQPL